MPSVTPTERDKPSGRREKLDVRSTPSIGTPFYSQLHLPGHCNKRTANVTNFPQLTSCWAARSQDKQTVGPKSPRFLRVLS